MMVESSQDVRISSPNRNAKVFFIWIWFDRVSNWVSPIVGFLYVEKLFYWDDWYQYEPWREAPLSNVTVMVEDGSREIRPHGSSGVTMVEL